MWDKVGGARNMNIVLKVDERGRVVIPSEVRRRVGIKRAVRLHVEGRRIILEPVEEPLEELSRLVKKVKIKASLEPELVSRIAEEQLTKEE